MIQKYSEEDQNTTQDTGERGVDCYMCVKGWGKKNQSWKGGFTCV